MHPYKINSHGDFECDGMIFTSNRDFGRYCDYTERAEEYWRKEDERQREERLLELEEKYGVRFDI